MTRQEIIEEWQRLLAALQKGSFMTAALYERRNKLIGLPVMVLSAIVGTAVFSSVTQEDATDPWVKVVVGLVSVTVTVLSGLQTFLGYGELAQKHKAAGPRYGALRREIEEALVSDADSLASVDLKSIRTRWDAVDQEAPPLPQRIYDKVTAEFKTKG